MYIHTGQPGQTAMFSDYSYGQVGKRSFHTTGWEVTFSFDLRGTAKERNGGQITISAGRVVSTRVVHDRSTPNGVHGHLSLFFSFHGVDFFDWVFWLGTDWCFEWMGSGWTGRTEYPSTAQHASSSAISVSFVIYASSIDLVRWETRMGDRIVKCACATHRERRSRRDEKSGSSQRQYCVSMIDK
ncbi:hypothetical protein VTL71DRAFT_6437 [Oculimacula yallundae]|uniref:Uncharacterized protein n=1 Tax=Oculimacula yallundae TaxID=86028 RepID=A0ABR4BX04_9HELO